MSQVKLQGPGKPDCCVGKLVAIAEPQGPGKPDFLFVFTKRQSQKGITLLNLPP